MNAAPPVIDERDQEAIFEELLDRAEQYTDDWDPHSSDVGQTLVRIFSTYESDIRKRLDEVPEKQLLAFLDALDFDRRRPQAARTPLTFSVSSELDRNVPIPGGTSAIADPGTGESQQFELPQESGFEATPAQLTDVIAVSPERDQILDHSAITDEEEITLFNECENLQSHDLYMEAESALNLDAGSTFTLRIDATQNADRLFADTIWEYYGEDEDGAEGWHPLEVVEETDHREDESRVEALQAQLHDQSDDQHVDSDTVAKRAFRITGAVTTHEINGVESRWLRCSMQERSNVLQTQITSLSIHVTSTDREGGLAPDLLLSNDIPIAPEEGEVRPFGRDPHPPVMFFVACQEAFTKPGGVVELEFQPSEAGTAEPATDGELVSPGDESDVAVPETGRGVLDGPPQISWEYWNGEGWTRLQSVTDETETLQEPGRVQFEVPADIGPTTVAGQENVWVRARLVSGSYGQPSFEVTDHGTPGQLVDTGDAPVFDDVVVHYERTDQEFETIFAYNNGSYSENLALELTSFTPFSELPDERQTVYFGFDSVLENGPLTLFIPVEDTTYPPSFDPGIQWEYCSDPERFEWKQLDVQDQTAGLTERGIVLLTFPQATTPVTCFDRERHWIRARVTEDEFDTAGARSAGDSADEETDSTAVTAASERTTRPPTLDGIYQNTQLAYNKISIEDEVLGSSDGSHEQSVTCAHAPVIDIDVWVDELSTLSEGECRRLADDRPHETEAEYDSRGELQAFWVRWEAVDDFLDSTPQDRHYVVSRTMGTVDFGDGDNGAIPPSGQDNVKATYTTGGGSEGNVAAGTVTDLKSSIALVDGVTNPIPADGGADIESTETLIERSTNRLKHRNRAVTPRDYEQVAKAAYPELARVTCQPEDSRVTVLIIPETEREKPVPSVELKHSVRETLAEHAPASLIADDSMDIVVRGPGYSEVSVDASVQARNVKSVSLLKNTIGQRLDEFLHPLTGKDGSGWSFGDVPAVDDLQAILANVNAISTVEGIDVTVTVNDERRALGEHETQQSLPTDTLVCSGSHQIRVSMAEGYDGA